MKKELLMIMVLIGLPTLFIMSLHDQTATGALTKEFGELRAQRIELYLDFPDIQQGIYKTIVYRVRQGLLANAHGNFYEGNNQLRFGHRFFDNEMVLFDELYQLMCLRPTGFEQEGRFISPGGVRVVSSPELPPGAEIHSIGVVPCDPVLQERAERTLLRIISLDLRLVELTIQNSNCPELAMPSMGRAYDNIGIGNFEAALTNLRSAWSKATTCR